MASVLYQKFMAIVGMFVDFTRYFVKIFFEKNDSISIIQTGYFAIDFFKNQWKSMKARTMKHKNFYLYQFSETLLNTAIKTVGILFAWLMLTVFNLSQSLGIFISISWACQVMALLIFSWLYQQNTLNIDTKKLLLYFCVLCAICFLLAMVNGHYLVFAMVFIVSSIFSIVLNPLGNSLTNQLYQDEDKGGGFKVRGFVNSINTILSPAISGFIIYYFDRQTIMMWCVILSVFSFLLFYPIKISQSVKEVNDNRKNTLVILLNHPVERVMAGISAMANFIVTPIIAYVIPYKISWQFNLSALYVGISESLFGLGMIIGSSVMIKYLNHYLGKHYTLSLSVVLLALGLLLFDVHHFYVFCVSLVLMGMGVVMFNINSTHIRCTATPKNIRQSFEFVFLCACIVSIPMGVLLTTWALEKGYLTYIYGAIALLLLGFSLASLLYQDIKKVYQISDNVLDEYYGNRYHKLYH